MLFHNICPLCLLAKHSVTLVLWHCRCLFVLACNTTPLRFICCNILCCTSAAGFTLHCRSWRLVDTTCYCPAALAAAALLYM